MLLSSRVASDLFLFTEVLAAELGGCGVESKRCIEVLTRPLRRGSGTAFSAVEEPENVGADEIDASMSVCEDVTSVAGCIKG